jgi:hypothetical protein
MVWMLSAAEDLTVLDVRISRGTKESTTLVVFVDGSGLSASPLAVIDHSLIYITHINRCFSQFPALIFLDTHPLVSRMNDTILLNWDAHAWLMVKLGWKGSCVVLQVY